MTLVGAGSNDPIWVQTQYASETGLAARKALYRGRGVDARIGDVEELPFEDKSLDAAIAAWMQSPLVVRRRPVVVADEPR